MIIYLTITGRATSVCHSGGHGALGECTLRGEFSLTAEPAVIGLNN